MDTEAALEKLREICLELPEVSERLSHGEPTWFAGKRSFVMFADRHHDDRVAFWCAAPEGAQELLMRLKPANYFRPPYVGPKGWVGVYLDVPADWNEIADVVHDAYRKVATPKLLARLKAAEA